MKNDNTTEDCEVPYTEVSRRCGASCSGDWSGSSCGPRPSIAVSTSLKARASR